MNIQGLKAYQNIQSITQPKGTEKPQAATQDAKGFGDFLKEAVQDVSNVQNKADQQIQGLVTNQPGFTSHEAMIALEKADVAFQLMNAVRSKIVRAYEEVMRTQV
jgi:flagellar hook-basal body complex protein FliE